VSTEQHETWQACFEIKGVVVDAVFPDQLPSIYSALSITRPDGSTLIAECSSTSRRPVARRDGCDGRDRPWHGGRRTPGDRSRCGRRRPRSVASGPTSR